MAASATGAMVSLIAVRFLMGMANAPLFPVMAGAIARWFPAGGWAFPERCQQRRPRVSVRRPRPDRDVPDHPVRLARIVLCARAAWILCRRVVVLVRARHGRPSIRRSRRRDSQLIRSRPGSSEPRTPAPGSWREVLVAARRAAARGQLLLHELRVLHVRAVALHLPGRGARILTAGKRIPVRAAVRDRRGACGRSADSSATRCAGASVRAGVAGCRR